MILNQYNLFRLINLGRYCVSWIILEGVDRSGKSTVAEFYKNKGYEVIHFSAPDKKFTEPGYAGPSYADEILDLYMSYDNKDVLFDRSIYGELVWPHVYGREPMLQEDDFEILREFEDRNDVQRILMVDPDKEAHWRRCVDNKEPLNANQFKIANRLYEKLAHEQLFMPRQLGDYVDQKAIENGENASPVEKPEPNHKRQVENSDTSKPADSGTVPEKSREDIPEDRFEKLETANAINQLLSKKIIRNKGPIFDSLEKDIREFLDSKLSEIFGSTTETQSFTEQEIQILKIFCQRLNEKKQGEQCE